MSMLDNHNDYEYVRVLNNLATAGHDVMRRGYASLEFSPSVSRWHMANPIITSKARGLSYRFMFAEALWVLRGLRNLRDPAVHDKLHPYSDDGLYMSGAYGPAFLEQRRYVVDALNEDMTTRQAVMTLWNRSPRPSKDIPCTVSLQFIMVRSPSLSWRLNCIAYMRSSDAWLGLPYDVFTFSMMTWHVLLSLHCRNETMVGDLHIIAGSQHIYAQHIDKARDLRVNIRELSGMFDPRRDTPASLENYLESLRDYKTEALFK